MNNCVYLIRQETVAVFNEFNIKRHDKLTENEWCKKMYNLTVI